MRPLRRKRSPETAIDLLFREARVAPGTVSEECGPVGAPEIEIPVAMLVVQVRTPGAANDSSLRQPVRPRLCAAIVPERPGEEYRHGPAGSIRSGRSLRAFRMGRVLRPGGVLGVHHISSISFPAIRSRGVYFGMNCAVAPVSKRTRTTASLPEYHAFVTTPAP